MRVAISSDAGGLVRDSVTLRSQIKRVVTPYPRIYRFLVGLYHFYHYTALPLARRAARPGRYRRQGGSDGIGAWPRQAVLSFDAEPGLGSTPDELRRSLARRGVEFAEGGWTFYVPPQAAAARLFPFLTGVYPRGCGLKLLKDFAPPHEARYTRHELNPSPGTKWMRSRTPSPADLKTVANYLHIRGLGPKVWDVVELKSGDQLFTAYVVEHVEGRRPTAREHEAFMTKLEAELDRGELETVHGRIRAAKDFAVPDANGNLIVDRASDSPLYVDFQCFRLIDEARSLTEIVLQQRKAIHFGDTRPWRGGGSYPYQSVPGLITGKRDIAVRWARYRAMFERAQLQFRDRVVYDVGCNTGLMLASALAAGALWGIGWDVPEVIDAARRVLAAMGATRLDLVPGNVGAGTDFAGSLPERFRSREGGVLFYLAVSNHIDYPAGVADLPWRYMLYEGHAGQTVAGEGERLAAVPWLRGGFEVLATDTFRDGDSAKRPVILLDRSPEP